MSGIRICWYRPWSLVRIITKAVEKRNGRDRRLHFLMPKHARYAVYTNRNRHKQCD